MYLLTLIHMRLTGILLFSCLLLGLVSCGGGGDPVQDDPPSNMLVQNCLRIVKNLLQPDGRYFSNWGSFGGGVEYEPSTHKAIFDLKNSTGSRLFVGRTIALEHAKKYAISLGVSGFSGQFGGENMGLYGISSNDFSGNTKLTFVQDGVYSLVFTYWGNDASYLLRIGIGLSAAETLAAADGSARFAVSDVMLEELFPASDVPSEYVLPGAGWAFNFSLDSRYDALTGIVQYGRGTECGDDYHNVWAVTADSFGNDDYDFPQVIPSLGHYVTYVDAVPGRLLAEAVLQIEDILDLKNYPSELAKPKGLIVEGGVNDILAGHSVKSLIDVASNLKAIASLRQIPLVYLTIAPFGNSAHWTADREAARTQYNSWVRMQAFEANVYVYDMAATKQEGGIANDSDPIRLDADLSSLDGLHPNSAGQLVIANGIVRILEKF